MAFTNTMRPMSGGLKRRLYCGAAAGCLAALAGGAQAAPAVFFTDDLSEGQTRFTQTVASAASDAVIFTYDFDMSSPSAFSVTEGGTTVYVRTFLGASPATYSYDGFQTWGVSYNAANGFAAVVDSGFTIEFYEDSGYTTPFASNAVGIQTYDWGTCCTGVNTTPDGTVAGSAIYMVFNPDTDASINLIGNITSSIPSTNHFVAAIDDRNSFSSVTLAPNGSGEAFGAGGYLMFSFVPIGSVPEGSSYVDVGDTATPSIPDIDAGGPYTTVQLNNGAVNPVFDGGELDLSAGGEVTSNFTVTANNGAINTNGFNAVFSGDLSGTGGLVKIGEGVLTLAGANSFTGGLGIAEGGGVEVASDAALGGASNAILFGGGALFTTASFVTERNTSIDGDGGAFSPAGETVLTHNGQIVGDGTLIKTGAGVLVLGGASNTFAGGVDIRDGVLAVGADAALGDIEGSVVLNGGAFRTLEGFATARGFEVGPENGAIDTTAGADLTLGGEVSGPGYLVKTGAGSLTVGGDLDLAGVTVLEGSLYLHSAQAEAAFFDVMSGGVLLGNGNLAGDVSVNAGGILSPGASPGTLTVAGDVTMTAGSTFLVEIDGYGTGTGAGNYDRLVLTGADSVFTAGGSLAPVLRGITGDANNDFTPEVGDVFTIVSAEGGVEGAFDALLQPQEGLPAHLRFEVGYDENAVRLFITPELFDNVVASYGRGNDRRAARALDAARGLSASAPSAAFFSSLRGLDDAQVASAFADISGEIHAIGLAVALRGANIVRNGYMFEGAGLTAESFSEACFGVPQTEENRLARDCASQDDAWLEISSSLQKVGADSLGYGYDDERYAVQAGVNLLRGDDYRLDLVGGYTRGDIAAARDEGYVETRTIGLRAAARLDDLTLNAAVGGTFARIETTSWVGVPGNTAPNESDKDAAIAHLDVAASYPAYSKPGLVIAPFVGVQAEYISAEGYAESGPAAYALEVEKRDLAAGRTRLGVAGGKSLKVFGMASKISTRGAWVQEFDSASFKRNVSLHGAGWEARSASIGDNLAEFSAAWKVEVLPGVVAGVEYKGQYSEQSKTNEGLIGVSVRW